MPQDFVRSGLCRDEGWRLLLLLLTQHSGGCFVSHGMGRMGKSVQPVQLSQLVTAETSGLTVQESCHSAPCARQSAACNAARCAPTLALDPRSTTCRISRSFWSHMRAVLRYLHAQQHSSTNNISAMSGLLTAGAVSTVAGGTPTWVCLMA